MADDNNLIKLTEPKEPSLFQAQVGYLFVKFMKIFFSIFFVVLGIAIILAPIVYGFSKDAFKPVLGLIVSIPLGVGICAVPINVTDWDNLWEFGDMPDKDDRKYRKY